MEEESSLSDKTDREPKSERSSSETEATVSDIPDRIRETGEAERKKVQEKGRLNLTYIFSGILAGTIALAFFNLGGQWERTKELLQIVLPIETGLLGSAVGYYFGTRPR
jgi:hypothetical protein